MMSPHPIGKLAFDGVRVCEDELLGDLDRGVRVAMRTLNLFRPSVGAFAVGMAQATLNSPVADTRIAFGGPLNDSKPCRTRSPKWRNEPQPLVCWSTPPPRPTTPESNGSAGGNGETVRDRGIPLSSSISPCGRPTAHVLYNAVTLRNTSTARFVPR
jgi:hypothetical protein